MHQLLAEKLGCCNVSGQALQSAGGIEVAVVLKFSIYSQHMACSCLYEVCSLVQKFSPRASKSAVFWLGRSAMRSCTSTLLNDVI